MLNAPGDVVDDEPGVLAPYCYSAKAEIVDRLIAGIDQHFDVEKKPDVPAGPPLGSRNVSSDR